MRLPTSWTAFATALLFLTSCTSNSEHSIDKGESSKSVTSWQQLTLKMSKDQGGLVFYREVESTDAPAVTISLNQAYLISLLPEVSTRIAVCAKPTKITAEYADPSTSYQNKVKGEGEVTAITAGKTTYIKVTTDDKSNPRLEVVDQQVALKAFRKSTKRAHTLSRVQEQIRCTDNDNKKSNGKNMVDFSLNSSALFAYDSARFSPKLGNGISTIKLLAKKILLQGDKVKRIVVIGYADPKGTDNYNKKISKKRAEVVVDLLIENGIDEDNIRAHGMGKKQLIIKDCAKKFPNDSKKEKECNEPNRRIEVTLFGAQ